MADVIRFVGGLVLKTKGGDEMPIPYPQTEEVLLDGQPAKRCPYQAGRDCDSVCALWINGKCAEVVKAEALARIAERVRRGLLTRIIGEGG